MRITTATALALLLGLGLALPAAAQQQEGQAGQEEPGAMTGSGTEVTGVVTSADEQTHEIVINGQTYVMPEEGGGAALMPAEGDEVTLYYREEGGQKVITRIGQPRQ